MALEVNKTKLHCFESQNGLATKKHEMSFINFLDTPSSCKNDGSLNTLGLSNKQQTL